MSLSQAAGRYLPSLEDEMRTVVEQASRALSPLAGPLLDDYSTMLSYHMGWSDTGGNPVQRGGGKRIRPLLCLMVCEAAGGDWQRAVPVAAAVELVHNFSLIHDDIQDKSDLRRGQPTVWRVWGVPLAINAGDALFTLAHLAVLRLPERGVTPSAALTALHILDETCLRLTQGQHLDMSFERRERVDINSYLHMIEGKSAVLLAAATSLGALVAGAPDASTESYRLYGLSLGMAFQVTDDILGIWGVQGQTGKSKETDLQSRKKTLPILIGLKRSPELRRLYAGSGPLGETEIARAVELLEAVGARAQAEEVARRYSEEALIHLEAAGPQGQAAEWLRELTAELLSRES